MANKKKKVKQKFIERVVSYDDDGNFGMTTDEERSDQGVRDRRKEDRRVRDEKTSLVRRKLGDRRNTYGVGFINPSGKEHIANTKRSFLDIHKDIHGGNLVAKNLSPFGIEINRVVGRTAPEEIQAIRSKREIARRGGQLRPKIKNRKGGLLGLGIAVGTAMMEGKEAYERSKEKQ